MKTKKIILILFLIFSLIISISVVSATEINNTTNVNQKEIDIYQINAEQNFIDEESGCCSVVVQVNENESVIAFRQDAVITSEKQGILIEEETWNGINIIKQRPITINDRYFLHALVTEDGWMCAIGGSTYDNPSQNIESLVKTMIINDEITEENVRKIVSYIKPYNYGHCIIKAPDGRFAICYYDTYMIGKLQPGEYLINPNYRESFKWGKYNSSNPVDVAIECLAKDDTGYNRRNINTFHYKVNNTSNGPVRYVDIYATNDNGKLVGLSTASIVVNVVYKNKTISKNIIPENPGKLYIDTHIFPNEKITNNNQKSNKNESINIPLSKGDWGNFTELNHLIKNSKSVLELNKNFIYNNETEFKDGIIIDKNIIINGNNHIISGNNLSRIFNIKSNNVILNNITFINGKSDLGGIIYWTGENGIINNCKFINTTANHAGSIYIDRANNGTITNCYFYNSASSGKGGTIILWKVNNYNLNKNTFVNSIANTGGSLYIGDCKNITITNNQFINSYGKIHGGAIYGEESETFISNSIFNNCKSDNGGAIEYNENKGKIENCIFNNNQGNLRGGDIYLLKSSPIISKCNFSNTIGKNGASIFIDTASSCIINLSTFTNIKATNTGILYITNSKNCKIIENIFNGNIANSGIISNVYNTNTSIINCNLTENNSIYNFYSNSTIIDKCYLKQIFIQTGEITINDSNIRNIILNSMRFLNSHLNLNNVSIKNNITINNENIIISNQINLNIISIDEKFIKATLTYNNIPIFLKNEFDLIDNENNHYKLNNITTDGIYIFNIDKKVNMTFKTFDNTIIPGFENLKVNSAPHIKTNDLTKYYKNDSQFIIKLIDENGKELANEKIIININNQEYIKFTNSTGEAKLNINLNPGKYSITTKAPVNGEKTSNIITILSTIASNDLIKIYKNESQFIAKFLDFDGSPLKNQNIIFNINGVFYNKITDNEGNAKLNINLQSGKYIITTINTKTNEYKSNNITVLTTIKSTDVIKFYSDEKQYIATFYDTNGTILTNQNIEFNINGVKYIKTTDEKGVAKLNLNLEPNNYILTAFNPITGELIKNDIIIKPLIISNDIEMTTTARTPYTAKLVDIKGNPLVNEKVILNINGICYTKTTNNFGEVMLNINLQQGDYIITTKWNNAITSNKINIK